MEAPTTNTAPASGEAEGNFMGSIWKITLMTMLGTACIGFAAHLFALNTRHKENMQEVAKIEFRTKQYTAYRDIYQKEGKAAADASLNLK